MKIWPWLLVAAAVIITRMDKPKDEKKPGAPATSGKRVARGIRKPDSVLIDFYVVR